MHCSPFMYLKDDVALIVPASELQYCEIIIKKRRCAKLYNPRIVHNFLRDIFLCCNVCNFSQYKSDLFLSILQIFEWWYFKKYGTSFIEQVSLNHISPLLGGTETTTSENGPIPNGTQQQSEPGN